jgi:hypothetical protein
MKCFVIAPRALYEAVGVLEATFNVPIPFEEWPYKLKDDSQELFPNSISRIARQRKISFEYDITKGLEQALSSLLAEYNNIDDAPRYHFVAAQTSREGVRVSPKYSEVEMENYAPSLSHYNEYIPNPGDPLEAVFGNISDQYSKTIEDKVYHYAPSCPAYIPWDSLRLLGRKPTLEYLDTVIWDYYLTTQTPITWSLLRVPVTHHEVLGCRIIRGFPQGERQLLISGQRPLSLALAIIQKDFGCLIVYEDLIFKEKCDLIYDAAGVPQIPRGGLIRYAYSLTNSVENILHDLVKAYSTQEGRGRYSVTNISANVYSIFPVGSSCLQGAGNIKALSSIMLPEDRVMTVPEVFQYVQSISGHTINIVDIDSGHLNEAIPSTVSTGAMRFDSWLTRFAKDGMTWRMEYHPYTRSYHLRYIAIDHFFDLTLPEGI